MEEKNEFDTTGLWSCPECGRVFYFKYNLDFHLVEDHEKLFNPSRREQKW
jgi:uncharacterized C2H2 Zn-finger protein